jgi:thymidylate synthase
MEVIAKTGSEAYVELMQAVLNEGEPTSPRGQLTFELLNVTVQVEDLEEAHVLNTARKVNTKILATEYMHLLGGLSSLEQLDLASGGRFSQFANGGRLLGAYGPRIRRQLPRVVELLSRDPDTRQAVLSIWTGREHEVDSRDVPCTLTVQFLLRDNQLHVRVSMRSNDVVLGIPYDWWMFSRLGMSVASALGVETGSYTHTVGSMHLYDRDLGIANDVEDIGFLAKPRLAVPPALTYVGDREDKVFRMIKLMQVAEDICLDDPSHWGADYLGMDWYHGHVPRITDVKQCVSCHCVVKTAEMSEHPQFCKACN